MTVAVGTPVGVLPPQRTIVVLYGPKAVGKSQVAGVLERRLGVHYVDADRLVLDLLAAGQEPDPVQGWLAPVRREVGEALQRYPRVSIEATGAWDSDWQLADQLAAAGARVLRVWVWTGRNEALARLAARTVQRAPVTAEEAAWIHDTATARAGLMPLDARIDTSGRPDPDRIVAAVAPLLASPE